MQRFRHGGIRRAEPDGLGRSTLGPVSEVESVQPLLPPSVWFYMGSLRRVTVGAGYSPRRLLSCTSRMRRAVHPVLRSSRASRRRQPRSSLRGQPRMLSWRLLTRLQAKQRLGVPRSAASLPLIRRSCPSVRGSGSRAPVNIRGFIRSPIPAAPSGETRSTFSSRTAPPRGVSGAVTSRLSVSSAATGESMRKVPRRSLHCSPSRIDQANNGPPQSSRSMTVAFAMPPPSHIVCSP
jgi:hypothetical protein